MELPVNRFKQALKENQPLFGLWLGIPDASCAEIGAGAGFDWVLIDTEHGPYDIKAVMSHLQAIAAYQVPAIVRPLEGDTALLKRLLDLGAQTLLIPMVDTAEQARQLVRALRYPPAGVRGLGTSMARAARWNRIPNYLHQADDEICLIVQIESVTAIENLEAIAAVEGVDALFVGPADLSASMGHLNDPEHTEVVDTVQKAFATIIAAGKQPGVLSVTKELTHYYISKGAKFIGVGVDASLLAQATRQLALQYKANTAD